MAVSANQSSAGSKPALGVALIGCGQIADAHLHTLSRIPSVRVVAVCDRHGDLARQAGERFGVARRYDDPATMLAETTPDVVHITTPPHSHHPLVLQCLRAGAHVYVEKPFTVDLAEAHELIAVAEAAGRRVCLGQDQLFDPAWMECRRRVRSGDVGDVVHIESVQGYDLAGPFGRLLASDPSHWVHRLPGGVFQNVMSHALARITDLMPDPDPRVIAHWFSPVSRTPFPTELRVLLVGAASTAALTFTGGARPVQKIARVFGSRRALEVDLDARTVTEFAAPTLPGPFGKVQLSWHRFAQASRNLATNLGRLRRSDLHYFEGMHGMFEAFYTSIQTGGEMPVPHAEALRLTRIMDRVFAECRGSEESQDRTPAFRRELTEVRA